ncbi:MAG: hypothetical protein K2W95_12965 [Candidatus Obscuribacterales bacterium]|nr:hypothetical protein [Candidatus Obscuribacterales bacterium]
MFRVLNSVKAVNQVITLLAFSFSIALAAVYLFFYDHVSAEHQSLSGLMHSPNSGSAMAKTDLLAAAVASTNGTVIQFSFTIMVIGAVVGYGWYLALGRNRTFTPELTDLWEELSAPLVVLTENLDITHANRAFLDLTDMSSTQAKAQSLTSLVVDTEGQQFLGSPDSLRQRSLSQEMTALLRSTRKGAAPHVVRMSLAHLSSDFSREKKRGAAFIATFRNLSAEYTVVAVRQQLWQVLGAVIKAHLRTARDLLAAVCESASARLTPESKKALILAQAESNRLERLILNLVLVEAGDSLPLKLDVAVHQSKTVIEKAVAALSSESAKTKHTIEVHGDNFEFRADQDVILQVLINLLSNAISHTPPGGKIVVRATKTDSKTRFDVEDSGSGIPEDQRSILFHKYKRGTKSTDRKGLGLGLALCKVLVEAHGGTISVTASPLGGCAFNFELP